MSESMGVNNNVNSSTETTNNKTLMSNKLDKNAFLHLLITQLKNQDPMNPMKDKEFIAQMAQFSSLEQLQQMNEKFDNGLSTLENMQVSIENLKTNIQKSMDDFHKSIDEKQKMSLTNDTEMINQLIKINKAVNSYNMKE